MAGQKQKSSLIYAFVARGTVVLAEHTDFSGNFNSIAYQCLQKLPANSNNNKFTFNCDAHTFNYLVDNGFSKLFYLPEVVFVINFTGFIGIFCGGRICYSIGDRKII